MDTHKVATRKVATRKEVTPRKEVTHRAATHLNPATLRSLVSNPDMEVLDLARLVYL